MQKEGSRYGSLREPLEEFRGGMNAHWYVVQTRPHSESLAERHLSLQGFRTYLPSRRRTVRHARSVRTVSSAYFECYLFVWFDLQKQRWTPINSTFGVHKLVMSDYLPVSVPHGVVETLILATDEEGILHPKRVFEPGQRIRITVGPFSEQLGTLDCVGRDGAVRVLLDIMNRAVPIYISGDNILTLP